MILKKWIWEGYDSIKQVGRKVFVLLESCGSERVCTIKQVVRKSVVLESCGFEEDMIVLNK